MWYITLYYIVFINRLPSVISIVFKFRPVVPMTSLHKSNIISFNRAASPEQSQYLFEKPSKNECGPVHFPGISCEETTTCDTARVPLRMAGLHDNVQAVCQPNKVMGMEYIDTAFRNSAYESLHRAPVKPNLFFTTKSPSNLLQSRTENFETIGEQTIPHHNRSPFRVVTDSTENKINPINMLRNNLWFRNRPSIKELRPQRALTTSSQKSTLTRQNNKFRPGFLGHQNPRFVQFPNITPKQNNMYPSISPRVSQAQYNHIPVQPSLPDYQTRSHREDLTYMKEPNNVQNQNDLRNYHERLISHQFLSRSPPNVPIRWTRADNTNIWSNDPFVSTNHYQTKKPILSQHIDYVQPDSTVQYVTLYNTYKTIFFPTKSPNMYGPQQVGQFNRGSVGENDYHSSFTQVESNQKRSNRYYFKKDESSRSTASELVNFRGQQSQEIVVDSNNRIKRHRRVKINRAGVTTSTMPPLPEGRTPPVIPDDPFAQKCMHVANCFAFNWKDGRTKKRNSLRTVKHFK